MVTVSSRARTSRARRGRFLAVLGLALESVGVLGLAVVGALRVVRSEVEYRGTAIGIVGFTLLIGLFLLGVTVAGLRWRRWALAPGITLQLFVSLAIAWPLAQQGQFALGAAMFALAVLTGYGLVTLVPELRRAGSPTDSGAKAT